MSIAASDRFESSSEFHDLAAIVDRLYDGPWRLIQLRGIPINSADIDRGDVDFLSTRESLNSLLQAAYGWVGAGRCHLRIRTRDPNKTSLMLISLDGRHFLNLDIWVRLWQVRGRRSCLRYEDCEPLLDAPATPIRRLPVRIESSIYINHLIEKKKDLSSDRVQERLRAYAEACAACGETELSEALASIALKRRIDEQCLAVVSAYLVNANLLPGPRGAPRWLEKVATEPIAALLSAPRTIKHCAVTGCDGSGKTTLAKELVRLEPQKFSFYTGKHLYRKSITYRFLVIFVRPLLFQGREKFDDTLAPWNYLRASVALQIMLWLRRRTITLIDRSIVDFLIIDRKTDRPRFHRLCWLMSVIGRRIPTIHLVSPNDILMLRKAEMTPLGQKQYDTLMFNQLAQCIPTDYSLFYNGRELAYSRKALSGLLDVISRS